VFTNISTSRFADVCQAAGHRWMAAAAESNTTPGDSRQ